MNFKKKKATEGTNETKITFGIKRCAECERNLRCSECACLAREEILLQEVKKLKIENQSLRGAANSYKLNYNKAVKDFTEFAQQAFENPFACRYCVHVFEDGNGRGCLWKEEHEEGCFGRYFEYDLNKTAGDTE